MDCEAFSMFSIADGHGIGEVKSVSHQSVIAEVDRYVKIHTVDFCMAA